MIGALKMNRRINVRLHVGGYWAEDGTYNGGETKCCWINFEEPSFRMLEGMISSGGFPENMSKFSYFPSGIDQNRKDVTCDTDVVEMVNALNEIDCVNIYVVRADDPYLDDVLIGGDEEEEEPKSDDEWIDFYRDDYVESEDSDDDGGVVGFHVGQEFISQAKCRETVEKYAVKERLNLRFQRSERKKVAVECVGENCEWRLYASINSRSPNMVVRSYRGTHTCYPTGVVDMYTALKIAGDFLNEFRTNPNLKADQIMQRLALKGLRVPKTKCQSARQMMLHIISDEYAEQFTRMYDYVEELKKTNPDSTVILGTKERVFEKFYTCFEAQKTGWKSACRRIIHFDGTFLKGRMKGQLLTAVGRDANNSMFIIAWALVPVENKVYWQWFMELLREDLDLDLGNGLALSSDQQKGLIHAVKNVVPYAEHRMCARHIFANLKKRHGSNDPLHKLFWKCARAYNRNVFDRNLEKMKAVKVDAYEELKRTVNSNWSRVFFSDITKSPAVEKNISESYNAILKEARRKPVIALLEDIRRHVMSSNNVKIKEMNNAKGLITPKALAIIENRKKSLKWCHPYSNGKGIYEVDHGRNKYVVRVRDTVSCTCRAYDISGIPCCHIMSLMYAEFKDTRLPETVVSDWYSVEKWKLCYSSLIFPVNGMELWDKHSDVVVMPPPDRIMPGRPKKNYRIRDPSEKDSREPSQTQDGISELEETPSEKIVVRCSNCGAYGHNKRTCKEAPINPPNPPKPPPEFPSFHADIVMTCGNCRQSGHNKQKCKLPSVPKPPNMRQGRPSKKPKASTPSTEVDSTKDS